MVVSTLATIGAQVRRTIRDSTTETPTNRFSVIAPTLALLRAYADNELYGNVEMWQTYRAKMRLPRSIRPVHNPTRRAVDFYAGRLYPGTWTLDGKPTPDGRAAKIRIPSDVIDQRSAFVLAALQCLDWGNWRSEIRRYVRESGTVGSVFVEMVDDLARCKIYPEVRPVEEVSDLLLDASGNVKEYELDFQAYDRERDEAYRFRKRITQTAIMVWRDERLLFNERNPYGFTPGIWVRHRHVGGLFGAPVIDGVIPKIDEANALATGIHDYVAKLRSQPQIIASNTQPVPLAAQSKGAETLTDDEMIRFQELIPWMWTQDVNTKTFPLMQPVPIEGAGIRLDRLLQEIADDLPETVLDKELRSQSQVTGPGAIRMSGDVVARYDEAQENHDAGIVKMMQMGTAIGGWRFNTGAWGRGADIDRQQVKFAPFNLDSYAAGDLDLELAYRPLHEASDIERLQTLAIKKDVAGLSDEMIQEELGYDDAARTALAAAKDRDAERFTVGQF